MEDGRWALKRQRSRLRPAGAGLRRGKQRSEIRGQMSEVRSRRSEVRGQRSEGELRIAECGLRNGERAEGARSEDRGPAFAEATAWQADIRGQSCNESSCICRFLIS
jgi:hypothetical protein